MSTQKENPLKEIMSNYLTNLVESPVKPPKHSKRKEKHVTSN